MYVAGLWGGIALRDWVGHDAAAVLLKDGQCVAAIEEERLTRVKHTRQSPRRSLAFCLSTAGIGVEAVDRFAVGIARSDATETAAARMISTIAGAPVDPRRVVLIDHHVAHAYSAFAASGFETSLVLSFDGRGDRSAGLVGIARRGAVDQLRDIAIGDSLGHLYLLVTNVLGYRLFDEYKVMGLAPYGDPERFRSTLQQLYTLHDEGRYTLALDRADVLLQACPRRRRGDDFTQEHKDLAAAVQEALETIVLHVATHVVTTTGMRDLCFAGGVAHNCSLNGRLARSGLFDRLFVHPAAHDAGTAAGAAALAYDRESTSARCAALRHVYLGTQAPASDVDAALDRWRDVVRTRRSDDVCRESARLLAGGAVIGWVQGRSEFGPRALGNRSILADPRPAENKRIVNAMVKKREAFRPFAPTVLAERAHEFFELPAAECNLAHMLYVVQVRPEKRALLGAVTHVDGSARIQTVSRDANERYWRLIQRFGEDTGVPIVLNTSFNNAWEPIVDSVNDAVVCFLTTGLHALVIGDRIVEKQPISKSTLLEMRVRTPESVARVSRYGSYWLEREEPSYVRHDKPATTAHVISEAAYRVLAADGERCLGDVLAAERSAEIARVAGEFWTLWEQRFVDVSPMACAAVDAGPRPVATPW
jgi:carbamoyltransferase